MMDQPDDITEDARLICICPGVSMEPGSSPSIIPDGPPTGKDPEFVRLAAERKRREQAADRS